MCMLSCFSFVELFATLWTVAFQAPLSMGCSRQKYWNSLPCPPQGIFPIQGSNPCLLRLLHCMWILYCWATREPQEEDMPSPYSFFCWLETEDSEILGTEEPQCGRSLGPWITMWRKAVHQPGTLLHEQETNFHCVKPPKLWGLFITASTIIFTYFELECDSPIPHRWVFLLVFKTKRKLFSCFIW